MIATPRKSAVLDQVAKACPGFVRRNGYVLMATGIPTCVWSFCVNPQDYRVEFCETKGGSHPVYERLAASRTEIEWVHGGPLHWDVSAESRARVAHVVGGAGWESGRPLLVDRLCTDMLRLQRAMEPFLARIRESA